MKQNPNISLAICTYNRSAHLAKALKGLSLLNDSLGIFEQEDELLIIDNNSSDDTKIIVQQFESKLPIKYSFESEQGLSVARNRALKTFTNEIIIFIDDDVSITESFLDAYREAINQYPECDFFGGKISVDWQGQKPDWFRSYDLPLINGLIVHYDMAHDGLEYSIKSLLPYGANFALRRRLIESVGEFDTKLGVKGENIGRGEETDYFLRALKKGFSGRFILNAEVYHRFESERVTTRYLYRYGIEKGRALKTKAKSSYIKKGISVLSYFVRGLLQLMKGRKDRFYQCIINIGIVVGQ